MTAAFALIYCYFASSPIVESLNVQEIDETSFRLAECKIGATEK